MGVPMARGKTFSFGIIGDIQYADHDDGGMMKHGKIVSGPTKGETRYFRNSLKKVANAVDDWNREDLAFCTQMGDIIDGRCNSALREGFSKIPDVGSGGVPETRLGEVLQVFDKLKCPRLDVLGNHELYNFKRDQIPELLNFTMDGVDRFYYSFCPYPGWRGIVLDSFDIAQIGYEKDHPNYKAARAILEKNNPRDTSCWGDWTTGLTDEQKRFVPLNGAIGREQLDWLRTELKSAAGAGEQVVIFTHVPIFCQGSSTLLWDYKDVLETIHEAGCVRACFYGHKHVGDYVCDDAGVHHFTMRAPLIVPPQNDCHAIVDVYPDRMVVRGRGYADSREVSWK